MRSTFVIALSLAAASLASAPTASAQRAAAPRTVTPEVAAAAPVRPVATYRLLASANDRTLPDHITVSDSAGALVASYRLANDNTTYPMLVVAFGTDLVLQGETRAGVLTLELFDGNSSPAAATKDSATTGRWHLAGRQGELRTRATR